MSGTPRRWIVSAVPVALIAAASVVGAVAVRAQDATPGAMGGMMEEMAHPGHIHSGTCDELGDVVFPLEDATSGGMGMGTPMAGMDMGSMATPGAGMGGETYRSVTEVEASLDDILAAEHTINFHLSEEEIEVYIACGDITGEAEAGTLEVELEELNGSGYTGRATLEDAGDGTTEVTVELMQSGMGMMATPEAMASESAEAQSVEIVDFAYDPTEITVPVGGTVAWTNDDPVPHTATAQDRDVLQSGTLTAGETFEQTFDAAGTYDYFCEFHPGMKGTIVVE